MSEDQQELNYGNFYQESDQDSHYYELQRATSSENNNNIASSSFSTSLSNEYHSNIESSNSSMGSFISDFTLNAGMLDSSFVSNSLLDITTLANSASSRMNIVPNAQYYAGNANVNGGIKLYPHKNSTTRNITPSISGLNSGTQSQRMPTYPRPVVLANASLQQQPQRNNVYNPYVPAQQQYRSASNLYMPTQQQYPNASNPYIPTQQQYPNAPNQGNNDLHPRVINAYFLDIMKEPVLNGPLLNEALNMYIEAMDSVNLATILFHTGKKKFTLNPQFIQRIAVRFNSIDVEFRAREASNALYGLRNMSSDNAEVRLLAKVLAGKLNQCHTVMVAQAIGNALYGMQVNQYQYHNVRVYLPQ